MYQAQEGIASFEGYANDKLRIFAGLYINPNQVVVTKASGIEGLEDLIGKKISIGAGHDSDVGVAIGYHRVGDDRSDTLIGRHRAEVELGVRLIRERR